MSGTDRPIEVLLLSYVYPPDNYAGALRPHRLAKYLARGGKQVQVVAAGSPEDCGDRGQVHRVRGEMAHAPRRSVWLWTEILIRFVVLCHDEGITWVPRVLRLIREWRRAGRFRGSPPVVISTSPPITTHLAGWMLKRRYGWGWIADFRDPLVGNPYRKERLRRIDRFWEKQIFKYADALVANTSAVAEMWLQRYPQHRDRIHVLWNGFDAEDAIGPLPIPSAREQRHLTHVGSLYGGRYPTVLMRSLARLIGSRKVNPETILVRLIGGANESPGDDAACPWLDYQPHQVPREEARRIAAQSDALLLLDVNTSGLGGHAGFQLPGKIFEYLCIGRPILACTRQGSPIEYILERAGVQFRCLYPEVPEAENDRRLLEFLSLGSEAVEPSEWFQTQFNATAQAAQLDRIIACVAARREGAPKPT